jgi:LytS/YehU family sensor histidine kinase
LSEWVYSEPNSKNIQLSALASGDYLFQLAASDGNGLWAEPLNWRFSIKPPYWQSWWFILSILAILILIGYAVFQFRMRQLEKINGMKLKLAEIEGESLRAQMNPHFVFNALNSIKSYIIKNSKEEAADYLTKFSQLIRAVLRNSTQKEISLKDELEALTLYLQIENLRLNQPFEYEINIEKDIDPAGTAFPPLIIQPFVENSIWHGFVHKKTGGKLTINIRKDEDKMSIDVIDDGVGREKSKEIEKSRERKRSYGIEITETRLNNITDKADIQIIDLYDDKGGSKGTQVEIKLPFRRLKTKNQ